ncbi:hypothetical protein TNCV_1944551 [Trichonephila clavipes]|nr:hypothetical protein TNCV_1944551 [Trichonephila clavipes]
MGIPYHPGMKATVDGMATHILYRHSQRQAIAAKAQVYFNNDPGLVWYFAGGLNATRKNDQLKGLLPNSTEAPKTITKQTAWHTVKSCFASPL